jgi:protein phosphatase
MQLRGAIASHVGNVRENNQDRAHFGGYVAAVADGMGGHQGGEMAASIAISEFLPIDQPIGPGGLVELVEEANRAVFERASDPELRGMGTTLVAVALRPDEEKISIVNVGDSRAYFFRNHDLSQLTNDHSLVEDLVRQKRLTKEEALHHPQRNILTRALGIASHVEVDRFLVDVQVGDRFLLCSDGLFNEVDEIDIARLLAESARPNEAAEQLVSAALAGAGRDNVTVAVVDVVAEGEGGNLSNRPAETLLVPTVGINTGEFEVTAESAAGTTQPAPAPATAAGPAPGVGRAEPQPVVPGEQVRNQNQPNPTSGLDGEPDHRMSALELDRLDEVPRYETAEYPTVEVHDRKRSRIGLMVTVIGVLALLAGIGYLGVSVVSKRGYYVGADGESRVTVFQGRPGGLLWVEPSPVGEGTDLALSDLTEEDQERVEAELTFPSEAEALAFIEELRDNQVSDLDPGSFDELQDSADQLEDGSSSTSSSSSTTTSTTAAPPSGGGTGDASEPDGASREGAATTDSTVVGEAGTENQLGT